MTIHRVAVLALDMALPMELGMPFQVLRPQTGAGYAVELCGEAAGEVRTTGGFSVVATRGLEALNHADTVIVPAYRPATTPPSAEVLDALRAAHARGARMVSICAGAFALGYAGLLDGRRATTHWGWAAELAARFPTVSVDPAVLFVDLGDVITGAGVASGIDVCLHLVRRDHGAAAANEAAREVVAAPHRDGGQAQYIERPAPMLRQGGTASTRAWALRHLGEPLTVAHLARHACLSERSVSRAFVAETGMSPLRWLTAARVDWARELLETTDWGLDRIAAECGLGTSANMRLHITRALSVSPSEYRTAFRR